MPRLFVALELPPATRQALAALGVGVPGARWVPPDQLHLTLRFLGPVPDSEVTDLRERLARVTAPSFSLALHGVGVFPPAPSRRKPARVLWAGLAPVEAVAALKTAIDAVLGPDPESEGRDFVPHVTLARFKDPPPPADLETFLTRHAGLTGAPFPVRGFVLFESRSQPNGVLYHPLETYRLGS